MQYVKFEKLHVSFIFRLISKLMSRSWPALYQRHSLSIKWKHRLIADSSLVSSQSPGSPTASINLLQAIRPATFKMRNWFPLFFWGFCWCHNWLIVKMSIIWASTVSEGLRTIQVMPPLPEEKCKKTFCSFKLTQWMNTVTILQVDYSSKSLEKLGIFICLKTAICKI